MPSYNLAYVAMGVNIVLGAYLQCLYLATCNVVGIREFECTSFKEFQAWKEKEEEHSNTFYAQCIGKKPLRDNTNESSGTGIIEKRNGYNL